MFATVRSPGVSSVDDLVTRLDMLKQLAGDRFEELDIAVSYAEQGMFELPRDVERHRDAIGRLKEIGATTIIVSGPTDAHPRATEFAQAFAELIIRA